VDGPPQAARLIAADRALGFLGVLAGCSCLVVATLLVRSPETGSADATEFAVSASAPGITATASSSSSTLGSSEPTTTTAPSAPIERTGASDAATSIAVPTVAPTDSSVVVEAAAPPASISLAAQGVSASVQAVGVLGSGNLQVPDDPLIVGWWTGSATPGAPKGNVVIAGHVDSHRYGVGTFKALLRVTAGDDVDLVDTAGRVHRYTIVSRRQTNKRDLPTELFDPEAPAGLVLVTCGGSFNTRTRHYDDNIIVLARPAD
jgi:cytoskeletal protein RodZ